MKFLRTAPGLDKQKIGEYLGSAGKEVLPVLTPHAAAEAAEAAAVAAAAAAAAVAAGDAAAASKEAGAAAAADAKAAGAHAAAADIDVLRSTRTKVGW